MNWSRPTKDSVPPPAITKVLLPYEFISSSSSLTDYVSNNDKKNIQNLIITTKSYQAKDAVKSVLKRLNSESNIIVLCNGALSVYEELIILFAEATEPEVQRSPQLILATTTHGAYQQQQESTNNIEDRSTLVHAGYGKTFVEAGHGVRARKDIEDITKIWNAANLNCHVIPSHEMQVLLWEKLAANCVINPLTAIFKCKNGELLQQSSFEKLQRDVISEIVRVYSELHQQQDGEDTTTTTMPITLTEESLTKFVLQVINDTAANRSSMYQDLISHQQKSEIDHLNGYVVRMADKLDIKCPVNEHIVEQIQEISSAFQ